MMDDPALEHELDKEFEYPPEPNCGICNGEGYVICKYIEGSIRQSCSCTKERWMKIPLYISWPTEQE